MFILAVLLLLMKWELAEAPCTAALDKWDFTSGSIPPSVLLACDVVEH
jgi:hypothetical protein